MAFIKKTLRPWQKEIAGYLLNEPEVATWLLEKIDDMLQYARAHEGIKYNPIMIRWSELYVLELEGIYDSVRNHTPKNHGLYDKLIVHEETSRVFRIGYSYY